jgi:large subunit ribosomal protein L29
MAKEKKVSTADLRQLGVAELKDKLLSTRKSLLQLKLKRGELKNPLKLRWLRRDIARLLTLMNERSTEGASEKSK